MENWNGSSYDISPGYTSIFNDGNWNFTDVTALEGLSGGATSWQGAWAVTAVR
jgi:hypothetical protein